LSFVGRPTQSLFRVDRTVIKQLANHLNQSPDFFAVDVNDFKFFKTESIFNFKEILIIGVKPLNDFRYNEINDFFTNIFKIVSQNRTNIKSILATFHGIGYGLDTVEIFKSQLLGLIKGIKLFNPKIEKFSFVERDSIRISEVYTFLKTEYLKFDLLLSPQNSYFYQYKENQYSTDINIDLVACLDITGSNHMDGFKKQLLEISDNIRKETLKYGKSIANFRLKIIVFKDIYFDDDALVYSNFFTLPYEKELMFDFLGKFYASSGGDEPESGLEALALAINSEWKNDFKNYRQIILLITDGSAHPLEKRNSKINLPILQNLPNNFDELTTIWSKMSPKNKRLLVFAPDVYPWKNISCDWDNSIHYEITDTLSISSIDFNPIVDLISRAI
jgi:hypothetical protein